MVVTPSKLYQIFKYAIYALLALNVGLFFIEDISNVAVTYQGGLHPGDVIVAFSDTIDTAAWLILLLLLELETYVIPDNAIKGWVDWLLSSLTFLCGVVILYSFYGYVATLNVPLEFQDYVASTHPCELLSSHPTLTTSLDDYFPLDVENCTTLSGNIYYNEALNMFASSEGLSIINRLAWLDVVNAGVWIIIVVILELEVFLESSKLFGTRFFYIYKSFKLMLYSILAVDVFYWWYLGKGIEAWDAFLWLAAFFFIEMNMLNWQEEVATSKRVPKNTGSALQR